MADFDTKINNHMHEFLTSPDLHDRVLKLEVRDEETNSRVKHLFIETAYGSYNDYPDLFDTDGYIRNYYEVDEVINLVRRAKILNYFPTVRDIYEEEFKKINKKHDILFR